MSLTWQAICNAGEDARLKFLRILNRFAGAFFAAIVTLSQAYPQALTQLGIPLPKWALIPAGVAWFMLVEYASRQPKPTA